MINNTKLNNDFEYRMESIVKEGEKEIVREKANIKAKIDDIYLLDLENIEDVNAYVDYMYNKTLSVVQEVEIKTRKRLNYEIHNYTSALKEMLMSEINDFTFEAHVDEVMESLVDKALEETKPFKQSLEKDIITKLSDYGEITIESESTSDLTNLLDEVEELIKQ